MELIIPIAAMGGLYMASKNVKKESFHTKDALPNVDIRDQNYIDNSIKEQEIPPEFSKTSKLSTVNKFSQPTVYTDKYFKGEDLVPKTSGSENFVSLSGNKVDASYFKHNNMTPFFGSKNRATILESESNEGILDTYSGSGTQHINKKEQSQ